MKDHRLLFSSLVLLLGAGLAWAAGQYEEKESAELAQALKGAKVSLKQGLVASAPKGKPISGKFEVEEGKLQLSVYTAKGGAFSEVLVDPKTGRVAKVEKIESGEDLTEAKEQAEAMAKAKTALGAAVDAAVKENPGYRPVSAIPALKDGHPTADVTLIKGDERKTASERLDQPRVGGSRATPEQRRQLPLLRPTGNGDERVEMHGRLKGVMTGVGTMVAAFATVASASDTVISGKWSMTLPVGLQATSANIPDDNSMSDDKIALGKLLYFDPRLSKDETVSCATCHNPFHGFADSTRTSTGVGGKHGTRNSPTLINRLFSADQFWDGRVKDLEHQVPGALLNPITMAMGSETEVAERVRGIKGYAPLFVKAFGDDTVDVGRISKAIAAYERTLVSGDSPYDRYQAGDKDALSASAIRGLALFTGKANCKTCHTGFNFTDEDYNNIGVGMAKPEPDVGRYAVTKNDADRGKFKTPTLRNVALTAPYMHDGSEETLDDVITFYDQGGIPNTNLSKEIRPLGLTAQEKQDLVAFLETLTGAVTNASPPKTLPQ